MENHKGFIVLVDISGYTNFVSKHNIDSSKNKKLDFGQAHAEHIISDLLEKVINELDEVLIINKLQGDAALFYGISRNNNYLSDKILEKLQTSFKVFSQRLEELKFVESCKCGTCADIGNLKLKSFVHYGDFLIKEINQFKEIAGQDVILAHRLMKNSISVSEYMLFTKSFTELKDINSLGSIENRVEKFRPNLVFTHHPSDVNIDHRIVHEAVTVACRQTPGFSVEELLFFEVLSSTEWRPVGKGTNFQPNYFVDISSTVEVKKRALLAYESEMRDFPHPRSLPASEALATWRGATVGAIAAEAFVLGRRVIN